MRYRDLVDLANQLRPIVRTQHAIECHNCTDPIHRQMVYFADESDPSNNEPWCRHCAVSILMALHVIDVNTSMAIPIYGPLPSWMMTGTPLSWTPPGPI